MTLDEFRFHVERVLLELLEPYPAVKTSKEPALEVAGFCDETLRATTPELAAHKLLEMVITKSQNQAPRHWKVLQIPGGFAGYSTGIVRILDFFVIEGGPLMRRFDVGFYI